MEAFKIRSDVSEKGEILIQNLPFKDKKNVEVIILFREGESTNQYSKTKLNKLTSSFGTISSDTEIQDEFLTRENLYNDTGR